MASGKAGAALTIVDAEEIRGHLSYFVQVRSDDAPVYPSLGLSLGPLPEQ